MTLRGVSGLVLVAMVAALGAVPASATQPESHERSIHYSDLDLSRPEGRRRLHQRIAAALEAVCGSFAGTQSSGGEQEAEEIAQCRAAARAQVDQRLAVVMAKGADVSSTR
ncbi:UrcA family protein [Novosphingobium rosa]|uniref:UrcA family protein n=1 Tax=Novosphingobium rosa TaxID=76978 RepID=UPI0008347DB3|nr:UrcA family protein [Novosphingobium rosa]